MGKHLAKLRHRRSESSEGQQIVGLSVLYREAVNREIVWVQTPPFRALGANAQSRGSQAVTTLPGIGSGQRATVRRVARAIRRRSTRENPKQALRRSPRGCAAPIVGCRARFPLLAGLSPCASLRRSGCSGGVCLELENAVAGSDPIIESNGSETSPHCPGAKCMIVSTRTVPHGAG